MQTRRDPVDRVERSAFQRRTAPYAIALYGHFLLLLILLRWLLPAPDASDPPLVLTATFSEPAVPVELPLVVTPLPPEEELKEPEDTIDSAAEDADPEDIASDDAPVMMAEPVAEAKETQPINAVTPVAVVTGADQRSAASQLKTKPRPLPPPPPIKPLTGPPHAVIDGDFAVWAIPARPLPGESYAIYIRIRLPERIREYRRSDLSGFIIGSDGYRKALGSPRADPVPIIDHTVTMAIPVVAARAVEADAVMIRSKYLRQHKVIRLIYDRLD